MSKQSTKEENNKQISFKVVEKENFINMILILYSENY